MNAVIGNNVSGLPMVIGGFNYTNVVLPQISNSYNFFYSTNFIPGSSTTQSADGILFYSGSNGIYFDSWNTGSVLLTTTLAGPYTWIQFTNNLPFIISNFISYYATETQTIPFASSNYVTRLGMINNPSASITSSGIYFYGNPVSSSNWIALVSSVGSNYVTVDTGIPRNDYLTSSLRTFLIKQNNPQTASFYINGTNVANIPFNLPNITCSKVIQIESGFGGTFSSSLYSLEIASN